MQIILFIITFLAGYFLARFCIFLIKKASYPWKQKAEDRKLEWEAIKEAQDMFEQWMDRRFKEEQWNREYPTAIVNPYIGLGLYIAPLQSCIRLIYPGQTSKFLEQGSYKKLVLQKFKELKENYEK